MTRARTPRPHEVDEAGRDERLLRALREGGHDPAWRTRGRCQTVDPELFFPAPTEPADAAVAVCRTCPVQGACLAWALQVGDLHGVWGGTTARERRAMSVVWRRSRVQDRPPVPPAIPIQRQPDPPVPAPAAEPAPAPPVAPPPVAGTSEVGPAMDRAELLRLVRVT